jgi:hypothetical protein
LDTEKGGNNFAANPKKLLYKLSVGVMAVAGGAGPN